MSNIYQKYPWVVILVILFMSVVSIGMIFYSFNLGYKITTKHAVLVDATMEAKLEVTQAHLWLEELVGGDKSVKRFKVKKHIEASKWYLNAMLHGGINGEGEFSPLDEKYFLLRNHVSEAIILIDSFRISSYQRVVNKDVMGAGSSSDIEYDKNFLEILNKIDTVETELQKVITQELNYFILIRNILIFIIIIINTFLLLSYKTVIRFQKDWLLKYFKVEDERDKLEELYKELRKAQSLIDTYIPISQTDLNGNIIHVNHAMCDLTGYSKDELMGKNHRLLRYPSEKAEKYKEMWKKILAGEVWEGEVKNRAKCGQVYWVNAHIHPLVDDEDKQIGYQALREDITDKKALEFLSSHDKLTSIYNRAKFDELFDYEMEQFCRYKNTFSIAIFDIDFFKKVNDTFGHQVGDTVLIECVKDMKSLIRESDVFARWGGEEFILLLPHTNKEDATIVIQKIRESIETHRFDKVENITLSIGLSEVIDGDTTTTLLKRIDDALYKAKEEGRNRLIVF